MDLNRGIDAPKQNRPGVPMELSPPEPMPDAPALTAQAARAEMLVEPARGGRPTAVYGSMQPPRGVAGAIRRAAYRFPDYRVRRWLLLLVADRIDAQEQRVRNLWKGRKGRSS